jgi:predicted DNA-binding WGR domain protein
VNGSAWRRAREKRKRGYREPVSAPATIKRPV